MQNSFGSGRLTRIGQSTLRMYYTRKFYSEKLERDSIQHLSGNYFGVTPEVITNNQLTYTPNATITDMVANGAAVIASPAAYEVKMRFPAPEILASYNSNKAQFQLVNSLSMRLPVSALDNNAGIEPPKYILMVLSKEKESVAEEDYTFTLTPVTVTMTTNGSGYYQTTVVGSVTPEVSNASAAQFLFDKAKIILSYSKQSLKY